VQPALIPQTFEQLSPLAVTRVDFSVWFQRLALIASDRFA
jgi:hypothetical protein